MSIGAGIIGQSRLRPVRSLVGNAAVISNGVGINYGMGVGAVRIAGFTYSIFDEAGLFDMTATAFIARLVAINGDYPFSALTFTPSTDLGGYDLLFDAIISDAGATQLSTAQSGMVTDDGLNVTAMLSQIVFPAGAPAGILPISTLVLHGDHYESHEFALSPGVTG